MTALVFVDTNVFVNARDAAEDIQALLVWQPQAVDTALLTRARYIEQRHHLSWWDSLVVGAAQLQNCAVLLSEDLQDGGNYGSVVVRSPFTLSAEGPIADYRVASASTRAHPQRGRPRAPRRRSSARPAASTAGRKIEIG